MEIITGFKLKYIFLDNNNWWNFYIKYHHLIRTSIVINVVKMLTCRTDILGFHTFTCPTCQHTLKVPHSCKSRFCSSCGKKATDQWIQKNISILPKTSWQHITFTMPSQLRDLFWFNRSLLNLLPSLSADIIKDISRKKKVSLGIYLALHTAGRDIKRNPHIHLSTTLGGLSLDNKQWIDNISFNYSSVKKMWRYKVINLLREQYKLNNLKLPKNLQHIKNYSSFNSWLNFLYQKQWVVHFNKPSNNHKLNIDYLGRYLKRPPIGETRIKHYDGNFVTFQYLDHYNNTHTTTTLSVHNFIARLISHIPDHNFRFIRYYGFLANRVRGKLLSIVYELLKSPMHFVNPIKWRDLIMKTFSYDPLKCPNCNDILLLSDITFSQKISLTSIHKNVSFCCT